MRRTERKFDIDLYSVSTILVASALWCLIAGCAVVDVEQKCKEQALIALQQYQDRRFLEAEQSYAAACKLAEASANSLQYPLMLRELARACVAQKKYDRAASILQQAADYYDQLLKTQNSTRFDRSTVDERKYETLATLGEVCMMNNKNIEARDAYAKAIALGEKIVEPPTIAGAVTQSYIKVLEKTGDREFAERLQRDLDVSSMTTDEYDERFNQAVKMISRGEYSGAEKQFETLEMASQGRVANGSRAGRVKAYIGLLKVVKNASLEAELPLNEAIRYMPVGPESVNEICLANTLLGLSKEMQGDTKSGIACYRRAFAVQPFLVVDSLMMARDGLTKFGHSKQVNIVVKRIRKISEDPAFQRLPITALDYVMLAKQQTLLEHFALARETRLKGLQHLEQDVTAIRFTEMRGAFQLYKIFVADHENELARRALRQIYIVGSRSPKGQMQLQKLLLSEHLPAEPPI